MGAVDDHLWSRETHDWAELQEPNALPLWGAMLSAAAVGPGTRVLDAGCGAGGASVEAARRGAHVNGLDVAEAPLAIARERVPDGDFRVGNLRHLPYADGTFDTVLVSDVLPYVPDPLAVLRELRRVCTPAGRLAIAVWSTPEECQQHAIIAAAQELLSAPLREDPFILSAPGGLDTLLGQVRLTITRDDVVACPYTYADRQAAWLAQASTRPLQAAVRVIGEKQLKERVLRALAPYVTATGSVHMHNRFRVVIAVPAADVHCG